MLPWCNAESDARVLRDWMQDVDHVKLRFYLACYCKLYPGEVQFVFCNALDALALWWSSATFN